MPLGFPCKTSQREFPNKEHSETRSASPEAIDEKPPSEAIDEKPSGPVELEDSDDEMEAIEQFGFGFRVSVLGFRGSSGPAAQRGVK